jgi:hypothetical protein
MDNVLSSKYLHGPWFWYVLYSYKFNLRKLNLMAEEMCILDTSVRNPERSVLHEACLKVSNSCYA